MKRLLGNENHLNIFYFPTKKETRKECIEEENLNTSHFGYSTLFWMLRRHDLVNVSNSLNG